MTRGWYGYVGLLVKVQKHILSLDYLNNTDMKKLIISAVALTLISFAPVRAFQGFVAQQQNVAGIVQEKVAVKPENLPQGIQNVIKSDDFKGWEVTSAFLITGEDKSQYYELNVKRGKENARVKLDKDGRNVD